MFLYSTHSALFLLLLSNYNSALSFSIPHQQLQQTLQQQRNLFNRIKYPSLAFSTLKISNFEATTIQLSNTKKNDDFSNNPRTRGLFFKRFTGDSTPYEFPVRPVKLVKQWPTQPPFTPQDFSRLDPTSDSAFYSIPRLLYHIDEPAVSSLTQYYRNSIPRGSTILDICSSWVSHYPMEFPQTMKKLVGLGMNGMELRMNDQIGNDDFVVRDLNVDPTLPFGNESFDVVTCVVSIDYLIEPIQVLKEVHRVLRPGGKVIISQSNRCFSTKAISMWLQMNDRQHLELINSYFQYAGGFEPRQAYDITATGPGSYGFDPMFIVEATKGEKMNEPE